MYADAYLAQTDGAYSAACGRRVPSRQVPQAPSMTSGLLRRTGARPCSRPAGSLSVLFFGECEVWWSDGRVVGHQRCAGWLQGLSFLGVCREVVGYQCCAGWLQGLSFLVVCREVVGYQVLRWMAAGAEFICGVLGDGVASALRWMWVG